MKTCFLIAAFSAAMYAQIPQLSFGATPTTPATPSSQTEMTESTVVATVAGISVTLGDLRKTLQSAPDTMAKMLQTDPKEAIRQIYIMRYLAAEGKKEKLDQKSPYKEDLETLIATLVETVMANAMVNQEHDGYEVTSQQIDDYYHKNQARWEEAKIKIILIAFKPQSLAGADPKESIEDRLKRQAQQAAEGEHPLSERSQAEAEKLAADLVKQLREGADFAKLVAQYSDDAESKASGGDFGTTIKATSSFAQDLKKVVLAMKQGEISDPVRQGNGLYIIRLEELTVQPLNDVLLQIAKEIRDNHLQEYMNDMRNRFAPQMLRPDFFAQPGKFLSGPLPATPAK